MSPFLIRGANMRLTVKTKSHDYDIIIEKGLIERSGSVIKQFVGENTAFVITDDNVWKIYGDKFSKILSDSGVKYDVMVLPHGEKTKSISHLTDIYNKMAEIKLTRTDYIIALGGGVVGDISGFAASTFLRGIKFIQIPTTLLAQVDSSVGGKVAVNLDGGKNLVGSFYQPKAVLIDPDMLSTLSERIFNDGMAEVIKYALIWDKELFSELEKDILDIEKIIYTCVDIKRQVVEEDEFDTGKRMILNFGHTYGHVIESAYNYETYTHGEGVAIGMARITERTEKMGITKVGTYDKIVSILKKYDLYFDDYSIDKETAANIMLRDKKSAGGSINYIVLKEIGTCEIMKMDRENTFLID